MVYIYLFIFVRSLRNLQPVRLGYNRWLGWLEAAWS
jgi:hypothetical protein